MLLIFQDIYRTLKQDFLINAHLIHRKPQIIRQFCCNVHVTSLPLYLLQRQPLRVKLKLGNPLNMQLPIK